MNFINKYKILITRNFYNENLNRSLKNNNIDNLIKWEIKRFYTN